MNLSCISPHFFPFRELGNAIIKEAQVDIFGNDLVDNRVRQSAKKVKITPRGWIFPVFPQPSCYLAEGFRHVEVDLRNPTGIPRSILRYRVNMIILSMQ